MAELGDGCGTGGSGCCDQGPMACVFGKALLAQSARCEQAVRIARGERTVIDCHSPTAHANCSTLAGLLQERARFALKLPVVGRPLLHQQALRLQCGGLAALRAALDVPQGDVHRLVNCAQERCDSLMELPWADIVPAMQAWEPRRRRGRPPAEAAP